MDVINVGDKGLLTVDGYFDTRTLIGQLGARVAVQPASAGAVAFGTAMRFRSEKTSIPGALSLTWIDVNSETEADYVRPRSRALAGEMAGMRGFLGWMGVVIAERLYTLALWEDPAAIRQIAASATIRPRSDKPLGRTSERPCIPVSGFLIISIHAGTGVRNVAP